jgi:aspartate dehydrogenase
VPAASIDVSSPSAGSVRASELLLIGCGAMGRQVMRDLRHDPRIRVSCILEEPQRCAEVRREVGDSVRVVSAVEEIARKPDFALECAGHRAVQTAVVALLRAGVDVIVASVGALAEPGLPEMLEQSALAGKAHVTLIPGAIAGIDALSAARARRLDAVSYTGRKPPHAWTGTPAERDFDLSKLDRATTIFSGTARAAARAYPKNANVAAMVALAGIGFERTEVTLLADPAVTANTHSIHARGQFGELQLTVSAQPLAENPKTSELAALSVLRAVRNRLSPVIV